MKNKYKKNVIPRPLVNLYIVILLFVISEPGLYEKTEADSVYAILKITLSSIFILYALVKRIKLNKVEYSLILMDVWLVLVSWLNHGNYYAGLVKFFLLYVMILIYELLKKNIENMINVFMLFMEIIVYLNYVSIIMYPDGITEQTWFLGQQNSIVRYLLPAYFISCLYLQVKKKIIRSVVLIIVINATALAIHSTTTLVGILFMDGVLLLEPVIEKFDFKVMVIGISALFLVVVVSQSPMINSLITGIFHKSISFHGRTPIWQFVLSEIAKKPISGYGRGNIMINEWYVATHTHSYWLEIMYRGGIVALSIFCYVLATINKKLEPLKSTQVYAVCGGAIISFLIMGIVEVHEYHLMFVIFLFAHDAELFNYKNFRVRLKK